MPLVLRSSAFRPLGEIPQQYTCDGEDRTPPLDWKDAPEGTKSFALVVDDPDAPDPKAPQKTFVHWVLYDLPGSSKGLTVLANYPPGTRQGKNDLGRIGWTGPCPPIGRHRYFFKLYALDVTLGDLKSPTKQKLEHAMAGHILAETALMGTYEKEKKKGT